MLSKGLTFAPTCDFDVYKTILDVNKFASDITIRKHFSSISAEEELQNPPSQSIQRKHHPAYLQWTIHRFIFEI